MATTNTEPQQPRIVYWLNATLFRCLNLVSLTANHNTELLSPKWPVALMAEIWKQGVILIT
jgi:hypothetical protein